MKFARRHAKREIRPYTRHNRRNHRALVGGVGDIPPPHQPAVRPALGGEAGCDFGCFDPVAWDHAEIRVYFGVDRDIAARPVGGVGRPAVVELVHHLGFVHWQVASSRLS